MSPSLITLRLVGVNETQAAVLRNAVSLAFPDRSARTERVASVGEATEAPDGGDEVLVLTGEGEAEVTAALAALDARGLPRWGVVWLSSSGPPLGAESLTREEMDPRVVARAIRSCIAQLAWRRRFARERGDVWTIGRRLTHDLRNPLGCIVTTSEMLKEILETDAPDHVPFVEPISEATAEMLDLINRLHFVAKSSAQPRPPEWLDVEATHQAAVDRLQREITRRGAAITAPEAWPEVFAVRTSLETIWWNLLSNALRHGGHPAKIETGWSEQRDEWQFWVADHGPGVPPERASQLFTPFDRLHLRHGGGIGLSIVHRLVELHGGRCDYELRPAGGARFSFTLPMVRPEGPATAEGWTAAAGSAKRSSDGWALSATPAV